MTAHQTSRVLLVDDTEQNRYVLSRILARAGLEVEQCTTGKEALERVKSCPDLVILDVKLPDISGYEVCRRIKTDPVTQSIPVLQISASFVSNESKAQALEGGADGYLTHPIDATVLVATVKSLLRLKQAELISRRIGAAVAIHGGRAAGIPGAAGYRKQSCALQSGFCGTERKNFQRSHWARWRGNPGTGAGQRGFSLSHAKPLVMWPSSSTGTTGFWLQLTQS